MFLNKITYDLHSSFGALISGRKKFHPKDRIYRKSRLDENLYTQDIHVNGDWTSSQHYQDLYNPINNALASLKVQLKEGKLELLKLPDLYEDLETLEPVAEHFIENFNESNYEIWISKVQEYLPVLKERHSSNTLIKEVDAVIQDLL